MTKETFVLALAPPSRQTRAARRRFTLRRAGRATIALVGAICLLLPLCAFGGHPVHAGRENPQPVPASARAAASPPRWGYILSSVFGAVLTFGAVVNDGGLASVGVKPAVPLSGSAVTADFQGYWLVGDDGGVFTFGDAHFYGSCPAVGSGCRTTLGPVVHIAPLPDGTGYWLASFAGGVYAFGNARYFGSADQVDPTSLPGGKNSVHLSAPIYTMAASPSGKGYWLVTMAGAVYSFGRAKYCGSLTHKKVRGLIVGMAPTADGKGYWLASTLGTVYAFGDAKSYGDCSDIGSGCRTLVGEIDSMTATPDGRGYWLFSTDGGVYTFGDAPFYGSALRP
jgi:hypothetical protein